MSSFIERYMHETDDQGHFSRATLQKMFHPPLPFPSGGYPFASVSLSPSAGELGSLPEEGGHSVSATSQFRLLDLDRQVRSWEEAEYTPTAGEWGLPDTDKYDYGEWGLSALADGEGGFGGSPELLPVAVLSPRLEAASSGDEETSRSVSAGFQGAGSGSASVCWFSEEDWDAGGGAYLEPVSLFYRIPLERSAKDEDEDEADRGEEEDDRRDNVTMTIEEDVFEEGRNGVESGSASAEAPLDIKSIFVEDFSEAVEPDPNAALVTSRRVSAGEYKESSRVAPGSSAAASSAKGLKRLQARSRSYLGAAVVRLGLGKRRRTATGLSSGTPVVRMEAAFQGGLPSSVSWYVGEVPGPTWIGRRMRDATKTGEKLRTAMTNAMRMVV
ncbi:hypothetical protein BD310DRAFT_967967 [Dichomitus squalens]|uniref:Uncharacterized protein n=1 Tax=Dichomitus squalens TaxID=114155 RepID=A0A4Q9PTS1_9APHY|nr:hypothetical protein BD310DRAFT_967967 [Dichomitus squalens]